MAEPADPEVPPYSVGDIETEAGAMRCPFCGTPIEEGARRCEACGLVLAAARPPGRASLVIRAGMLTVLVISVGIIGGVVIGRAVVALTPPHQAAAVPNAPTPEASSVPASAGATPPSIPAQAIAALQGTTVLNGRLVAEADPLATALSLKTFSTSDVIVVLRRMRVDIRAGTAMVTSLGVWPGAREHQAALAAFYDSLDAEINAGLAASAQSSAVYKATTQRVLTLLRQVAPLDDAARSLASDAGINLPPIVIPAAVR
jgi:predicted nucleic acid-binding Zn ribbon protein